MSIVVKTRRGVEWKNRLISGKRVKWVYEKKAVAMTLPGDRNRHSQGRAIGLDVERRREGVNKKRRKSY
jgi:hypothetical protein